MELLCCKGTPGIKDQCPSGYWRDDPNNQCDGIIIPYCANNSYDPICDCINSEINFPQCNDNNCMEHGYQTNNMRNTKCPDIIKCSQNLSEINATTGAKVNMQQIQICGSDPNLQQKLEAAAPKILEQAAIDKTPAGQAVKLADKLNESVITPKEYYSEIFKLYKIQIIFILFFIIILIILGVIKYYKKRNVKSNS